MIKESWVAGLRCGSMSAKQMGGYSGGCTCTVGSVRGLERAAATSSSILQWSVATIQSVWRGEKPLSLPLQQWVMKFQQPLFATTLSDLPSLYFDVLACWAKWQSVRWSVVESTWLPSPRRESKWVRKWRQERSDRGKWVGREVEKNHLSWLLNKKIRSLKGIWKKSE